MLPALPALLGLALIAGCTTPPPPETRTANEWGEYLLWRPAGETRGLILRLGEHLPAEAPRELLGQGLAVADIDAVEYLRRAQALPAVEGECHYLAGAVQWTAQRIEHDLGLSGYRPPLLLGTGPGALLTLILLEQAPQGVFAGALAEAYENRPLHFARPLCPRSADGQAPLSTPPRPSAPWSVQTVATDRPEASATIRVLDSPQDVAREKQRLIDALDRRKEDALPVIEVARAKMADRPLVIIYSGDGGWRDIDKQLADRLAQADYTVLGVDALRYFWTRREPRQVAGDLSRLLARHPDQGRSVVLIGYSFGADILPAVYSALPEGDRERIRLLALLAPGLITDFEIHMSGWIGGRPDGQQVLSVAKTAETLPMDRVVCVYGLDEKESLCRETSMQDSERIGLPGGHHFDKDYAALAARLVQAIETRH
ncbi:MAG: AcvB/VirJ family lysyl-phosphatidylglycerol hydrolase [Pseudomonadota bacterium]